MTIQKEGADLFKAALSCAQSRELERALANQPRDHAGVRLSGIPELRPFLSPTGPVGTIAVSVLGPECLPVRAILFDKNVHQNWSLGWHQDRTIAVRQRIGIDGFGPWSIKSGMVHVEPPFDLLAGMVTVRLHLDAVPETNAPLLVAPGSHKRGRILTAENSRSRSAMRHHHLSRRGRRHLDLCGAHFACVEGRQPAAASPGSAGRLRCRRASGRFGVAGCLSLADYRRVASE